MYIDTKHDLQNRRKNFTENTFSEHTSLQHLHFPRILLQPIGLSLSGCTKHSSLLHTTQWHKSHNMFQCIVRMYRSLYSASYKHYMNMTQQFKYQQGQVFVNTKNAKNTPHNNNHTSHVQRSRYNEHAVKALMWITKAKWNTKTKLLQRQPQSLKTIIYSPIVFLSNPASLQITGSSRAIDIGRWATNSRWSSPEWFWF